MGRRGDPRLNHSTAAYIIDIDRNSNGKDTP